MFELSVTRPKMIFSENPVLFMAATKIFGLLLEIYQVIPSIADTRGYLAASRAFGEVGEGLAAQTVGVLAVR